MGATTPIHGLPYPAEADRADVPVDMEALANALDGALPPVVVNGRWLKGSGGAMVWAAIAAADVPDLSATYQPLAARAAANGYASLDGGTKVPVAQIPDLSGTYQALAGKGANNGYAGLDATGKVPAAQLPPSAGATYTGSTGLVGSATTNSITHNGYGARITPTRSGKCVFSFTGSNARQGSGDGSNAWALNLRYGVGSSPALGAAQTGTQAGATLSNSYDSYGGSMHNGVATIGITKVVTGLVLGTSYWFDLATQNLVIDAMNIDGWEL
ncbi:MAG TPA: hypothetical protein VHS03_06185 [Gaiellaceae bacterium]|jgi:hypothetical protein|nr:hypothetical protein [Gaiellaceae bacterium]